MYSVLLFSDLLQTSVLFFNKTSTEFSFKQNENDSKVENETPGHSYVALTVKHLYIQYSRMFFRAH